MSKARIMVVEDEGIVAMDIKLRLTSMGYEVVGHATSGGQAIRLASDTQPDLIMMDIKLKGPMDGIETAEQIRSQKDIPIIYLTAFADESTLQRARITEPSGYILKPFQERELAIAIDMALYKHQMENSLRESEERFMLAIQGANDGIWDWNLNQNTIYFSQRCNDIIGYKEQKMGASLEEWLLCVHPDDRDRLQQAIEHHLDGLTDHLECEVQMLFNGGGTRWVLTRGLAVRDARNRPYRIAGSISDITALKLAQEQLAYDAYHDALTSLPNRVLFLDRLEQALERRRRYHQDGLAVLFLDLDHFKVVNDSLGHQAGDQLLIQISSRLQKIIRASDTVARMGGDEFVVLLESANNASYACNVAERIEDVIRMPIHILEHELVISASIGVVMITDDHHQPSDVLRDADVAMYRAKSLGKNRYELFEINLSHRASERLEIEKSLITALDKKEYRIHFQPIYSFPNRQIVGLEALLRLYPGGKNPIPPAVFIPIAEEMGLINEIGDWVLLESCRKMSEWHQRYPDESHLNLHINISVKQLVSPTFVRRVQEILDISKLEPSRLAFEITENVFTENIDQISLVLEQLTMLGIKIMIDNFGTGYASLGYIRRFPINTIKLDRNFIFPAEYDEKNAEVVKAILVLANQLGLKAVAEGIETEEQAEYLVDLKCHFGQGFLFSRPLEINKVEEYLENNAHKEVSLGSH
jgi:diguanylate cyclase (GGDEF)-like protein/PAS domain S-box-containing protein